MLLKYVDMTYFSRYIYCICASAAHDPQINVLEIEMMKTGNRLLIFRQGFGKTFPTNNLRTPSSSLSFPAQ